MSVFWPEPVVMSSSGISCQSAWDSLTCNLPQHTPIYSLHTPSWIQEPDNTHWISEYLAFACHRGSSHGGGKKNSGYSLGKKKKPKKTLARFLLSIPSCSLGNVLYYEKGKKRKKRFLPSSFLAGFFHGAAIASAVWGWVSVLRFWNFARWTCHCEWEQNHLSITATYTPPSESTRQRWVFLIVVLT